MNKLANLIKLVTSLVIGLGIIGLISFFSGMPLLSSFNVKWVPMSPITACFFVYLGLVYLCKEDKLRVWKNYITPVLFLISIFSLVKFTAYWFGLDNRLEFAIISIIPKLGVAPLKIMSISSAVIFFFAGLCALIYVFKKTANTRRVFLGNLYGVLSSLIFCAGLVFILDYIYNAPFLYNSEKIIPMAFPSAIAFCLLGLGQIMANKEEYFPLWFLTGDSTAAKLSRYYIPLTVIMIFFIDIMHHAFPQFFTHTNYPLFSAALIVFFVISSAIINLIIGRILGNSLERAIKAREKAEKEVLAISKFPSENPSPILRIARDGEILFANKASDELLLKWGVKVGEKAPQRLQALVKKALEIVKLKPQEEEEEEEEEEEVKGKIFSFVVTPIYDSGYVNLYGRDITERKKAQEQVKLSEIRFREMFSRMSSAVAVYKPVNDGEDFIFNDCNDALLHIEQIKKEELIGRCVTEVFPGVKAFGFLKVLQRVYQTGNPEHCPISFYKDQRIAGWRENFVYKLPSGEVVAIYDDVTERKQPAEALEKSAKNWQATFDNISDLITLLDEKFIILRANQAVVGYLNKPLEQIIGKACYELFHGTSAPPEICPCNKVRQSKKHEEAQIYITDKKIWLNVSIDPLLDENGNLCGAIHVLRDITQIKNAEVILLRGKTELEDLVKARTEQLNLKQKELLDARRLSDIGILAASIAHELRNPLGVIKTAIFNIKRKAKNPELDSHLNNIDKKISESDHIIMNLLSYAKLKVPRYEKVICSDLMKECLENVANKYKDWDIQVDFKCNCDSQNYFMADRAQIVELYSNILDNTYLSYPDKKGKVEIRGNIEKERGVFSIIFKDYGAGIEDHLIHKLGTPFFTTRARGIGLGLTVCKQIVLLHGGTLDIKSTKGKGTIVTIVLPIDKVI